MRDQPIQGSGGMALPLVLVFALLLSGMSVTALLTGIMDARIAAYNKNAIQAFTLAEAVLDALLADGIQRLREPGSTDLACGVYEFCLEDFPRSSAVLAMTPDDLRLAPDIRRRADVPLPRLSEALASSARYFPVHVLQAEVSVDGAARAHMDALFAVAVVPQEHAL